MSRSGYSEDFDGTTWEGIMWRGAVASALRGARGQAFLRELILALDELPEPKLDAYVFGSGDCVCALGAVARRRGILEQLRGFDEDSDSDQVAAAASKHLNIARAMAAEIMFENDEACGWDETPEARWRRVRAWAVENLREAEASASG